MHESKVRTLSIGVLLPILLLVVAALIGLSRPQEEKQEAAQPSRQALTVLFENEAREMDTQTYLLGVVLGEMPAEFETEALRAQAIAARTYTLKTAHDGIAHGKNRICTDAGCCQAYIDPTTYIASGGSEAAVQRVRQAVSDTEGQVLVYNGELIMATYFSCAGDATEDAVAVWGQAYPYLRSVPSPGEQNARYYTDTCTFSPEEFQKALGIRLEGKVEQWFAEPTRTDGGGVDTMCICGIPYRGTTLRALLQLRSTNFTVSVENGQIVVQTKGNGHRVGLSQYGANAMAKDGRRAEQILRYYYNGVEIVQYTEEIAKTDENFS